MPSQSGTDEYGNRICPEDIVYSIVHAPKTWKASSQLLSHLPAISEDGLGHGPFFNLVYNESLLTFMAFPSFCIQ